MRIFDVHEESRLQLLRQAQWHASAFSFLSANVHEGCAPCPPSALGPVARGCDAGRDDRFILGKPWASLNILEGYSYDMFLFF